MANSDQPNEDSGTPPRAHTIAAGLSAKGSARRRFAKVGAGASAGVIATLTSQPAMAQVLCKSMSSMMSGNLSANHKHVECAGRSPGYWKNKPSAWQGALTSPTTKFQALFGTSYRTSALNGYTCMQVVTANAFPREKDPDNVAMHIMATMLNVRSGKITFLTENQVRAVWNSYSANGTYEPTAGVTWNGYQIVDYLKKTMG